MDEVERIDTGGEGQRVGVSMTRDGAGDVDEMHHRAAENEPERIGVVRQNDLNSFSGRILPALCFHRSPLACSPVSLSACWPVSLWARLACLVSRLRHSELAAI